MGMVGISLGLESRMRGVAPSQSTPTLRIVPNGESHAFVIAPHDDLGAIAYELTYGNGGDESTPGASIGAPFGGWRWTGTHQLDAVTDDPTDPVGTLHDDIGSTDSAMQANFGSSLFGGHYHGGIVLLSSAVPDMTTERYVSDFNFGYEATITWPGGETAAVLFDMAIQPDGNLASSIQYTSLAAFTRVFLSMVIATGFDEYSTDGGVTFSDGPSSGNTDLGSNADVILRQGSTGYQIAVSTDQDGLTGITNELTGNGSRIKHYVRMTSAGGALGSATLARSIAFAKTDPDPEPTFTPITDTFEGSGDPPSGYTRVLGPNGGSTTSDQNVGVWQVRAGASPAAPNRWVRPISGATLDGMTQYRVEIDYASIQSNTGMVIYLTKDGTGSTASGNQLPFNGSETSYNLGSNTATTATLTFTLPAGVDPYLTFDAANLANRGVDISEIRITEL